VNGFSRDDAKRLQELLEHELGKLRQVFELTSMQAELLASDDIDAFDSSLDSRQELIEEINGLHQESDVLMQSYISVTSSGAAEKADGIEKAAADARAILESCAELNEKNATAAKEKAEEYIKRIGKLSLSRKSLRLYTTDVPNKPELFDKTT